MSKYKIIEETIRKIKNLEIQGATSIAISGLEAILKEIENNPSLVNDKDFLKKIEELKYARRNEPLLRNSIDIFLETKDLRDIPLRILIEELKKSKEKISNYAYKLVRNGYKVYTHCHSSTVTLSLIKAKKNNRNFVVYNTETRPKYQGRITAKELANNGIKVRHFVDFALNHFLKYIDIVFVGGDAILYNGDFINKVGTSIIAILSNKYDIPFYSLISILKYSKESIEDFEIETRDPKEVWEIKNENIEIINYAFDRVSKKYVTSYITEMGFIEPMDIPKYFRNYFKFLIRKIENANR